MSALHRLAFAALGAALVVAPLAVGCRKPDSAPRAHAASPGSASVFPAAGSTKPPLPDPRSEIDVVEWTFPKGTAAFEKRVVVIVPKPLPPGAKLPVLVVLHGMGETVDPTTGAYGWLRAYEVDATLSRLRHPPLDEEAFKGFVTKEHLAEVNASLAAKPFAGLVIACPYLPREIGGETVPFDAYLRFLSEELLPRLRKEAPVLDSVRATGIDGVSLGGANALRFALMRPDLFGVVGALQPALYDDVGMAEWIAVKLAGRPLRLVTSEEDVYRDTIVSTSKILRDRKVPHELFVTPGPHDYVWNKGPGAIEMLLWHDRTLGR